jgi:hypothetical protein
VAYFTTVASGKRVALDAEFIFTAAIGSKFCLGYTTGQPIID